MIIPEADQVGRELGASDAEPEGQRKRPKALLGPRYWFMNDSSQTDDENREQQRQRGQKASEENAPDFAHAGFSVGRLGICYCANEATATLPSSRVVRGSALLMVIGRNILAAVGRSLKHASCPEPLVGAPRFHPSCRRRPAPTQVLTSGAAPIGGAPDAIMD